MNLLDILLIVATWLAVIIWIPPVLSSINLASLNCIPEDNPIGSDLTASDPIFDSLSEQLKLLGFEFVGQMKQIVAFLVHIGDGPRNITYSFRENSSLCQHLPHVTI